MGTIFLVFMCWRNLEIVPLRHGASTRVVLKCLRLGFFCECVVPECQNDYSYFSDCTTLSSLWRTYCEERQTSSGGTSERVTLLWSKLEKRKKDVDLDELLCQATYMCRKCFYAYDKMLQNKEVGI